MTSTKPRGESSEGCFTASSPGCIPADATKTSSLEDVASGQSSACIPIVGSGRCLHLRYTSSPAPIPANTPKSDTISLLRKLGAEFLGTSLLLIVVVGSGIRAELTSDDGGLQLFINAVSTTAGLYGLIIILGPVSGAHFNPCVSLVDALYGDMGWKPLGQYCLFQISGGILGTILANVLYQLPVAISETERWGYALWISEVIATATLILIIHGCIRTGQKASMPAAVSLWVGGGYFFTSSSIFANPAVTIARVFTDTFTGIEPQSMAVYLLFQLVGALLGFGLCKLFFPLHPHLQQDDTLYRRACILELKDVYGTNEG